jgi:hypothetical protein
MVRAIVRLTSLLLLLLFSRASLASDSERLGQEDDIREAVFRHQFEHNASGQQKTAHAYCLAILVNDKDSDPSEQFMKRFVHHKPPVRKWSACHWTSVEVVENRTGRSALIFSVSKIDWTSDTEVTVGGGYEEANVSSSGNAYTVKKQNGKWVVTNDQMTVISENENHQPPLGPADKTTNGNVRA